MNYGTADIILRWMYSDTFDSKYGDSIILEILSYSILYKLDSLRDRFVSLLAFPFTSN